MFNGITNAAILRRQSGGRDEVHALTHGVWRGLEDENNGE